MSTAPAWVWQIMFFVFVLVGVALVLFLDPVWARLSIPRQNPIISTAIVGLAAAIVAAAGWWIFVAGKPEGRLEFFATATVADYPAGTTIAGIPWRRPFAEVQVRIANPSSRDYEDLDLLLLSDHLIAGIGQASSLPGVAFEVKDGRTVHMESHRQDGRREAIPLTVLGNGVGYHLRCSRLPAKQTLEIALATVTGLGDIDEPIKNQFDPSYRIRLSISDKAIWYGKENRPDSVYYPKAAPTMLTVTGTYSVAQFDQTVSETVPIKDILGDAAKKVRSQGGLAPSK